MNDNRISFLIEQSQIFARLEKGEALTLAELEGVLAPGCFSAIELLGLIREHPNGITDGEIKETLGHSKRSQVIPKTLKALAEGGAILREDLPSELSDSGRIERINKPTEP